MKYEINSFIYHELPSKNIVVQSPIGIVEIFDSQMKNFIKKIDNANDDNLVDHNVILKHFEEDTDAAVNFLINFGVLNKESSFNFNIHRITLCTNDKVFLELINNFNKSNKKSIFDKIITPSQFLELEFSADDYIMFYLNPYDRGFIKKMKEKVDKESAYTQIAYVYNNNIYIDNIYNESWKAPCHFCNINNIRTQLRVGIHEKITYQHIIDDIFEKDSSFKIETKFEHSQLVFLYDMLLKSINKLIRINVDKTELNYGNEFLEVTKLNMSDYTVTKDMAVHWELCDCYG